MVRGSVPTIREVHHPGYAEYLKAKLEAESLAAASEDVTPDVTKSVRSRDCFLCLKRSKHHVPISGSVEPGIAKADQKLGSYRGTVIAKHFWFKRHELAGQVACFRCWLKVDEFHQLYSEIEAAHAQQRRLKPQVQVEQEPEFQVKEEAIEFENESPFELEPVEFSATENDQEIYIKLEPESSSLAEEDHETPPVEIKVEESSDDESPPTKRTKTNESTSRVSCELCTKTFEQTSQLFEHCTEVHRAKQQTTCCGEKFTEQARLDEHLRNHAEASISRYSVSKYDVVIKKPDEI